MGFLGSDEEDGRRWKKKKKKMEEGEYKLGGFFWESLIEGAEEKNKGKEGRGEGRTEKARKKWKNGFPLLLFLNYYYHYFNFGGLPFFGDSNFGERGNWKRRRRRPPPLLWFFFETVKNGMRSCS